MYCHDVRHTGRSPYSTADNPGIEKWRFPTTGEAEGDVVIDENGTLYVGTISYFYAIYPNGTLKWKYDISSIVSAPAIDENGIIYVGTIWAKPNYLYAFYPNGTLKWKYKTGNHIWSSPAIGNDGTIYFGDHNNYINTLYPNGTLKWRYKTGNAVYSSPAIGNDGTIYCGSWDSKLYALYPNNGTVKWKYDTGGSIRTGPCIADDGTIYAVSLDNYLHAVYQNGTMKWKTNVGGGTSPTIAQDGTIYAGYSKLYAINPENGSVKWKFDPGEYRSIRGATLCNSADGTIYFGTNIGEYYGGEIIALNPNGTEKWRKKIGNVESAPAIGEDGTVYIGSPHLGYGYLHAIGPGDVKQLHIERPDEGYLYLFDHPLLKTRSGKTIAIGDLDVKASVTLPSEVEKVRFALDNQVTYPRERITYDDTEPPYEWHIDASELNNHFWSYRLEVTAYYKGGCRWTDYMSILFIHLF
jgi:outer membrane protein assembly factor BamB